MERENYLTKCYTLKKKKCGSKETQTWSYMWNNFHIFFVRSQIQKYINKS